MTGLFDIVKKGDDLGKLVEAVASAISPRDVEENLQQLGLKVEVDTVDWNQWATIRIEGGENETGVILTLRLAKAEIGYDTLNISEDEVTDAQVDAVATFLSESEDTGSRETARRVIAIAKRTV